MSELKIGMVGLDTSHCAAFSELLNNPANQHHVPGGRVVAAFPGGSPEFSLSRNRVGEITKRLTEQHGLKIYDSIGELARSVDAVLLHSVDGRQHLAQFREAAEAGKPVFIDKPLATTVADARAIAVISRQKGAPVYSCSAIRFASGIDALNPVKPVMGCIAYGPMAILDDFPGLFWYGVHSAEVLFSKMGRGCREVSVVRTDFADVVTGRWEDGRLGSLYGYRIGKGGGFGCVVFAEGEVLSSAALGDVPYYAKLLPTVLEFFRTGVSPVDIEEAIEITAFLEAANAARETGTKVAVKLG